MCSLRPKWYFRIHVGRTVCETSDMKFCHLQNCGPHVPRCTKCVTSLTVPTSLSTVEHFLVDPCMSKISSLTWKSGKAYWLIASQHGIPDATEWNRGHCRGSLRQPRRLSELNYQQSATTLRPDAEAGPPISPTLLTMPLQAPTIW